MSDSIVMPRELAAFIASSHWTFAKTMPQWPHEYIVRGQVDEQLFVKLVQHIRENGYEGKFYRKLITYYDADGMVYWTMGAPLEETTIINRCKKENSYASRLRDGTLPVSNKGQTGADDAVGPSA